MLHIDLSHSKPLVWANIHFSVVVVMMMIITIWLVMPCEVIRNILYLRNIGTMRHHNPEDHHHHHESLISSCFFTL
jgi:hypothetical protein